VNVLLRFDTEDYLLEADDDATLRLATWLTQQKIRATFKLVGERARVLEKRGRKDVIAALRKHEIGYHSNFHSVHPTQAEYMSPLGWDEGVAEFVRRESPGVNDIKRIFHVGPSCYGQPGSSWGPQSYGAMRRLGIPVYLDAGHHVRVDGQPHYYGGILTLYDLATTVRTNLGGEADLKAGEAAFRERHDIARDTGGPVSIYYHPNEFIHAEFWDAVNFADGANPPRASWKAPRLRPEAEAERAFDTFQSFVRYIQSFPDVRFITASEAARIYRDRALGHAFTAREVSDMARAVGKDVTFQRRGDLALAPADLLLLFARALTGRKPIVEATPAGPSEPAPTAPDKVTVAYEQLVRSTEDVLAYVERHGRVPSAVWLGSTAVAPETYMVALARVLAEDRRPEPDAPITIERAMLGAAKYVSADDPKLWGWVIFPKGFHAPAMMELAKRQAWTIKPAIAGN
jgi:hypothetical protein